MSKFPSMFRRAQSTGSDLRSRSRFSRYSESSFHSIGEVDRIDEEEDGLKSPTSSSPPSSPRVSMKIRLAHIFLRPQLKFQGRKCSFGTQFSASSPASKPHSIPEH